MPIYMNFPDITGAVTTDGYEGWIECLSISWGTMRHVVSATGQSSVRETSRPSVQEMTVMKVLDSASNALLQAGIQGAAKDVTINFVKTDKGELESYLTYVLGSSLVSSYAVSSGGDRPTEVFSLNFLSIESTMTTVNPDGSPGDPDVMSHDYSL